MATGLITGVPLLGGCCGPCMGTPNDCPDPCHDLDPSSPYYQGCLKQVMVTIIPVTILNWLSESARRWAAGTCGVGSPPVLIHAPATDYTDAVNEALSILQDFDWTSPPLPWTGDQFYGDLGILSCPAMQTLRYGPYLDDESVGYVYRWDNTDINWSVYPDAAFFTDRYGFMLPYDSVHGTDSQNGPFSGLIWDLRDIPNRCFWTNDYINGYPTFTATWTRATGFTKICESRRAGHFNGITPADNVLDTIDNCRLIHAATDGNIYAGNDGGSPGILDLGSPVYGAPPPVPDPYDPTSTITEYYEGWVDWFYHTCIDCTCP